MTLKIVLVQIDYYCRSKFQKYTNKKCITYYIEQEGATYGQRAKFGPRGENFQLYKSLFYWNLAREALKKGALRPANKNSCPHLYQSLFTGKVYFIGLAPGMNRRYESCPNETCPNESFPTKVSQNKIFPIAKVSQVRKMPKFGTKVI